MNQFDDFIYKLRDSWNCYVDAEIFSAPHDPEKNIGFLIESKAIIGNVFEKFITHQEEILNNFKYIFTHDRSLLGLSPKIKWAPASFVWIEKPKIYHKSYLLSMITSRKAFTPVQKIRIETAVHLQSLGVPVYGRGFNQIDKKEHGLCPYMFSVTIENAVYDGYFTEKIMDCFATGTIPIYRGDPTIGEFFNTDGIITLGENLDLSMLTPELYYEKLPAIKENLEIVKQFVSNQDWVAKKYLGEIHE